MLNCCQAASRGGACVRNHAQIWVQRILPAVCGMTIEEKQPEDVKYHSMNAVCGMAGTILDLDATGELQSRFC